MFNELRQYLPGKGTLVIDDYNLYFLLPQHTVVSPANPNESLHCDRLVRFKRATKAVNKSLDIMKYSLALVLWGRGLIPKIYTFMITLRTEKEIYLSFMKYNEA